MNSLPVFLKNKSLDLTSEFLQQSLKSVSFPCVAPADWKVSGGCTLDKITAF